MLDVPYLLTLKPHLKPKPTSILGLTASLEMVYFTLLPPQSRHQPISPPHAHNTIEYSNEEEKNQ